MWDFIRATKPLDFYVITVDDTILMYLRYRSNLGFRSKWDGILESGNAVVEMTNCESKAKFFGFHLERSNELKADSQQNQLRFL